MTFWILAAVLTFAAALCVVLPLASTSRQQNEPDSLDFDKGIYRARLEEIDNDLRLGRISPEEAKTATAEEGRKLIALSEKQSVPKSFSVSDPWISKGALAIGLIVLPVAAVATYLALGNPGMPDQSLASRMQVSPEQQSISELVSRAEGHLLKNPDDARGWSVLAPVYSRLGRREDAVKAWANVLRLAPQTPEIRATLAEAMMAVSEGVVTDRAKELFRAELAENPASAKARFYLAMALDQEGRHREAVDAWLELISGGTDASPWMAAAREFLSASAEAAKMSDDELQTLLAKVTPEAGRGPSSQDIAAADNMTAEERTQMIAGMVEGLAERLTEEPGDKPGWQRLIRAYIVLGKKEKAQEAIDTAGELHKDDAAFLRSLEQAQQLLDQG